MLRMTTTEIALFSTCIGAGAAILSQFVANKLKDKSEKKKTKIDLIAEDRKLTYMILLNQVSYVQVGITIEYYYQLAVINQKNKNDNSSLQRHHDEIKFSNSLHAEYCTLIGDYCKNIYKFITYFGHTSELENILHKIINEPHEDFTGMFDDLKNYDDLFKSYHMEHKSASIKLETYKSYFYDMRQIIERVSKKSL